MQKIRLITRDYGFLDGMAPSSAPFSKPKKERGPEFDGIDCTRSIIQLTLQKLNHEGLYPWSL